MILVFVDQEKEAALVYTDDHDTAQDMCTVFKCRYIDFSQISKGFAWRLPLPRILDFLCYYGGKFQLLSLGDDVSRCAEFTTVIGSSRAERRKKKNVSRSRVESK